MTDWIKLEPSEFNQQVKTNVHGVDITVGLAPFDIPDAVRGHYDNDLDQFIIEFSYLDDHEKLLPSWQNENLTLYVGEHTGCIYEIHVNVKNLKADIVRLRMEMQEAFERLATQDRYSARKRHYELASDVISRHAQELLPSC